MSEIKRVALTTLEPQKVSDKVIKKLCKTVRISVILPESNEDDCPTYNYKDQLAAVVKKKVKPPKDSNGVVENGLDPFGENDEDVRRIALEMEAKYGSGVTKKKRKDRKDDYADIGMGYDESDSFIDNTDGYDEIIPKNVTTLHGGFYVNSGALEFKTDDEASSDASSSASSSSGTSSVSESEGEDKQKPKSRKRILETSADSESDTANPAQKEKKLKVQSPTTSMQQAIKKKMFSSSKIQVKKRRPIDPNKKTVKDLLREKREDLNMSVPDELKTVEDNIEKDSSKENKKPMNITSVTDAIESVLKQVVEKDDTNKNTSNEVIQNVVLPQIKIDPPPSQPKDKEKQNLTRLEKEEIIKLPENLPVDIESILTKIKEAALNYKGEGKKAFFTQEVNALLLNWEKKSKIISKSSRIKVYEHLAQYVNCTKDTLIRRARILDLEDHEKRLRGLEIKLKDSIDAVMPTLEENFQQNKLSKESENNEELKGTKEPKKKFVWTEETKRHLKDAVGVKKRCLILEGKYKDNMLEQQLVDYLRTHIQPLWPEGWMVVNSIKKILNRMQDLSKSLSHSARSSSAGSNSIDVSKHSNLSITPVTNGKTNSEKPEVTNSITVTKVVNNNEVIVLDTPKVISKNLDINHVNPVKEIEERKDASKQEIFVNEHNKSNESLPKVESNEKISDFSLHPKKADVFKPYIDDPPSSHVKKLFPETDKIRVYQKQQKPTDIYKPYVDEIISVDSSVTEKLSTVPHEDKPQYPDKDKFDKRPYTEKEKHLIQEKDKRDQETDKYGEQFYQEKDKQSGKSHQEKEKRGGHSHQEKPKHGGHSYHEKDKHATNSHHEKDKHSHHDKIKYSSHAHHDKDKQHYYEKNKHGHVYHEKDKHSGYSYNDKDKPSSHSVKENAGSTVHNYNKKEKYSPHAYSGKEEQVPLTYPDKHNPHTYVEMDKHTMHTYSEKDKHGVHTYADKDKHNSHTSHSYSDKDKHFRTYSDKDKHSEKDKKLEENSINHPIVTTSHLDVIAHTEKPPSLVKSIEKPTDLSKFQMFKTSYPDTPKTLLDDLAAYQSKDVNCYKQIDERHHHRSVEIPKSVSQDISNFTNSPFGPVNDFSTRRDVTSTKHRSTSAHSYPGGSTVNEHPALLEESGVIVKNLPPMDKLPREDKMENQIGLINSHCQGVKRKLLETYTRTTNEMNSTNYYPQVVSSTPLVTSKSDGDGQKDIQMVMENLKALQKLSCSPVKNDNSSSSPVSVIAFNKNFASSKTSSSHSSRNDINRDFPSGFQEEFQKAFINSLQQMAASNNKSSYNNGS